MAKLEIPTSDFTAELVAGNVASAKKAAGAEVGQILMIPPQNIRRLDGFNVRVKTQDYLDHKNDIAASIRANGFFPNKPLGGYVAKEGDENVFYLTDGYTRLDAVDSLNDPEFGDGGEKIERVPFMVKPQGQTLEDLTVALIQDNEGRPLTVYEKAIVAARLKSYGMDNAVIATRLGKTERYVSDLLVLAGAPSKVRALVIAGKISPTEAVKQLRKDGGKAAEKLEAATKTAEASGKKKATGKDVRKAAGEAAPKRKAAPASDPVALPGKDVSTETFVFTAGQILEADAIKVVSRIAEGVWWNFVDDSKVNVFIEEDIEIAVTVVRAAEASAEPTTPDLSAVADPASVDTGDL